MSMVSWTVTGKFQLIVDLGDVAHPHVGGVVQRPGGRGERADEQAEQGRLAGTGRAHDADEVVVSHGEVDGVEHERAAEVVGHAVEVHERGEGIGGHWG